MAQKQPKCGRLWLADGSIVRRRAERPNHVWSYDFVFDVAEMLMERGYELTHETVRDWEARFAPLLTERLRAKRRGRAGVSWYIDETYVKVAGDGATSTARLTATGS